MRDLRSDANVPVKKAKRRERERGGFREKGEGKRGKEDVQDDFE